MLVLVKWKFGRGPCISRRLKANDDEGGFCDSCLVGLATELLRLDLFHELLRYWNLP